MIVLKKEKNIKPVQSFEDAQKLVDDGWEVYINKTGSKIVPSKKEVKKVKKKSSK